MWVKQLLAFSPGAVAANFAQVARAMVGTLLKCGDADFARSGVLGLGAEALLANADASFSGLVVLGVAIGLFAVEAVVAASIFRKLADPRPVEL